MKLLYLRLHHSIISGLVHIFCGTISVCVMDNSVSHSIRYVFNFSEILVVCDDFVKRSTIIWSFVISVISRVSQAI